MIYNTKELKQYINILQNNLNTIQHSKTYRIWQVYCKTRKFLKIIIIGQIKSLFPKHKINTEYIKYIPSIRIETKFKDVSIVIPTYNGESTLSFLFKAITTQFNIINPELVIVDSGSTDKTLHIAKQHNATIIQIDKKNFNHGLTRNLGAQKAKGKSIIFTVQDAIPINNKTYGNLLSLLHLNKNIACVSTKQIPYPSVDLFAKWQVMHHNNALQLENSNFISTYPQKTNFYKLPFLEKRIISLYDDVCSAVKKDIFFKLGGYNKLSFAEDLDFSLRALQKGYNIAVTGESGVIHSHTRSISYFLRRYYADNKIVLNLLKEHQKTKFNSINSLLYTIQNTYLFTKNMLSINSVRKLIPTYPDAFKLVLLKKKNITFNNSEFIKIIAELTNDIQNTTQSKYDKQGIDVDIFEQFRSIYNNAYNLIDFSAFDNNSISEFIDKIFTIILGSHLVLLSLKNKRAGDNRLEKKLDEILLKDI